MVVYYTGTGNSRYVAQRFAAALGDDLITANEYIKNNTPAALHSDRPWVFVSPTYGWQIPHIFADFLRRGSFTGSREAYFVMTCGTEIGNAGSRIAALCADIGLDYRGVLEVVMPENYVAMFYVPGAEESAQIIAAAQPSIDRGIACVQRGEPFPAPKVSLIDRFKTHPVNGIFYKFFVKSGPFTVSDACIGCGKCALSCPVNGIDIAERKPHWNGRARTAWPASAAARSTPSSTDARAGASHAISARNINEYSEKRTPHRTSGAGFALLTDNTPAAAA